MATSSSDSNSTQNSQNSSCFLYIKFIVENVVVFFYLFWTGLLRKVFRFVFPQKQKSLKDEIILVTGGANGIGREICLELVKIEPQLTIVIWDVDGAKAKETVAELLDLGCRKAHSFVVDLADRQKIKIGAQRIQNTVGDVTMLFNNAGITGQAGDGWKMDPDILEKVIQVNFLSHCSTIREFLPAMIQRGSGHIIGTCSVAGVITGPYMSPYIASKHAVKSYVGCIKEDVRQLPGNPKIHFTLAYPELTQTSMAASFNCRSKKYPFIVPNRTAKSVAKVIVEGVLRNEEHIFIPGLYRFLPTIVAIFPSMFQKAFEITGIEYDRNC